jgi:EpsI family protein
VTSRRLSTIVVFALMLSAFAGAHVWRPTVHMADSRPKIELETLFPKSFGGWALDNRMPVQLISPDQAAVLNRIYNQTLSRTYVNAQGDRIMLSVAYGGDQSDGTRAHRPEVCYPAQGFQIIASGDAVLDIDQHALRVRKLVSRLGNRNEPITYWITVGERVTRGGTEQKLAQLSYSTRGIVPDGMLVRVSSIDANPEHAYRVHKDFIADMARALPAGQQSLVVGIPAG